MGAVQQLPGLQAAVARMPRSDVGRRPDRAGHRQHSVDFCNRPLLEHAPGRFLDRWLWIRFRLRGQYVGDAEFLLSLRRLSMHAALDGNLAWNSGTHLTQKQWFGYVLFLPIGSR